MEEIKTTIDIVSITVRSLSVASWGLFAGAMLTEALVLVTYWKSLTPLDFFAWYKANDQRLLKFFGPLTSVTVLLAIATAIVCIWQGHYVRWVTLTNAIISAIVLFSFFIYFQKANLSFATASLENDNVATELTRWALWHWCRTIFSLVALVLSILSLVF